MVAMLLSSKLIYNCKGTIDDNVLNDLSIIRRIQ